MKNPAHEAVSIMESATLPPTAQALETIILAAYANASQTPLEMKQADLASSMGLSGATIRRNARILASSGRWKVVSGVGHQATTYEALFLEEGK